MTDAQSALAQVREAMAAGPTPGEWACYDDSNDGKTSRIEIVAIGKTVARIYRSVPEQDLPNARLIAACSPANIAAILAHVDAQEAEIERLRAGLRAVSDLIALKALVAERDKRRQLAEARAEREAMANVLPGVYYMDPPDGGDVSLLKQLQRMSNDAARYRLLRRKFAIISDGEGNAEFCPINLPRPTYIAPNTAIELDTALDRERLGLDGAKRPPTPVGWSDTDWIKHLQEQAEQPHPLAGQHINQGSMDAAADAYEAEYYDALKRDARRYRDWLRGGANIPPESNRWRRWEVRHWNGGYWNTLFAEAMDAAIDEAMDLTRPAEES